MSNEEYEACSKFVRYLDDQILRAARGDDEQVLDVAPAGRFWLGRLASEEAVVNLGLGDRGERLDPCAIGLIVRPQTAGPWSFSARVQLSVWSQNSATKQWSKQRLAPQLICIDVPATGESTAHGRDLLGTALAQLVGQPGLSCEVRVEVRPDLSDQREVSVLLVNTSPEELAGLKDTNFYECSLAIAGLATTPFLLEALPDSFRYDRRVAAYGINCGVAQTQDGFVTQDTVVAERARPVYWKAEAPAPDLTFERLKTDPLPSLQALVRALGEWGEAAWSSRQMDERARQGSWNSAMRQEADREAQRFAVEAERVQAGVRELESNPNLLKAFRLMNRAIEHSSRGRYSAWRPFQIGFLLANLRCITNPAEEARTADVVWFATGGGKTETYLGFVITAALYERMQGRTGGVTAWSRFPLRMLSLQQTQRFADAMAGAELARREASIPGRAFSVGFLVGDNATPNRIRRDPKNSWDPDPDDEKMPARFRVLQRCPFCHDSSLVMAFDRRSWQLQHRCSHEGCPWGQPGLPFYIVDEEIFRFLPTIVIGTLDKAALISLQASMRGLVGPPLGLCQGAEHGYTYAPRKERPSGCLVPGCRATKTQLDMAPERFAPIFRLQDELHLLKDSLGAVDAHYEAILDHLEHELTGQSCKILASSATLTGFEKQVDVLYRRSARVFPLQGPTIDDGFWTSDSRQLARRFVAVAPRGVTVEFAIDRSVTEMQTIVRRLRDDPAGICREAGIDVRFAPQLLSLYGTDVVYGNTLRDLEAVTRSLETQVQVNGPLHTANLTGKTQFEDVRATLDRLENPESDFDSRLHVITASAMMSHGVDIDRLNVMTVLGLPLTTAEFIQATARVGRRWPALVLVMHKIARERDASVYRSFEHFVRQGDRFVEAVPVTRRSRRVLERTFTGLLMARMLAVHEPTSSGGLTTPAKLREFARSHKLNADTEYQALCRALALNEAPDEPMRIALRKWLDRFFSALMQPVGNQQWPSDLSPTGPPMRSLRDVEEQAPVRGMVY